MWFQFQGDFELRQARVVASLPRERVGILTVSCCMLWWIWTFGSNADILVRHESEIEEDMKFALIEIQHQLDRDQAGRTVHDMETDSNGDIRSPF